jgi:beta-lactamase regulating signal transducer with metallopeptidase domain
MESIRSPAGHTEPPATAAESASTYTYLMALWIMGCAYLTWRWIRGWLGLRRIVKNAQVVSNPQVMDVVRKTAALLHLSRLPVIRSSDEDISPFTVGIWHTSVVLPGILVQEVPSNQLQAVLTHEFAHLKRRDPLIGWILTICETLYYFYPFFRMAKRKLMQERETACDEYVLAESRTKPKIYAMALIEAAEKYRGRSLKMIPIAIAAESFTHLKKRLEYLVTDFKPVGRLSRGTTVLLIILAILTLPGIALTGKSAPCRSLTVKVTDHQGKPVAQAGVEVMSGYRPVAEALTDQDGTASISIPFNISVQWILALKSGSGLDYFENYDSIIMDKGTLPVEELPERIDLVLEGARTINIHAVDSDEEPVAGVRFVPWIIARKDKACYLNLSGSKLAAVTSDQNGHSKFDWIPTGSFEEPGTTLLVQSDGFHWPDPPKGIYSIEENLDITARLVRNATISGKVFFPDGHPASGILVQGEGRGRGHHFCRTQSRTTQDGSYTLSVYPNQSYVIFAGDKNWAGHHIGLFADEKGTVAGTDLVLSRGTLVHGRFVNEEGGQKPVPGGLVLLGQENPTIPEAVRAKFSGYWEKFQSVGFVHMAYTDENGCYSFRVRPGNYILCAVGGAPGGIHEPQKFTISDESTEEIRRDMKCVGQVIEWTGFLAKANLQQTFDYAFHPVSAGNKNGACMQCHRPHRSTRMEIPPCEPGKKILKENKGKSAKEITELCLECHPK